MDTGVTGAARGAPINEKRGGRPGVLDGNGEGGAGKTVALTTGGSAALVLTGYMALAGLGWLPSNDQISDLKSQLNEMRIEAVRNNAALQAQVAELRADQAVANAAATAAMTDRFHRSDMVDWVGELARANPELDVPPVPRN